MIRALGRRPTLVGARVAVSLLFLLYGTILGTWTARIPAVKHHLGLGDAQLSIALLAFAAGAILGMQASGRLVDRLGSRKVMVPAVLADALLLVLAAYAMNLAGLAVSLVAFGAVHGTLKCGDERQRRRGAAGVGASNHLVLSRRVQRRRIPRRCHRWPVRPRWARGRRHLRERGRWRRRDRDARLVAPVAVRVRP
jgi:MFS family permease